MRVRRLPAGPPAASGARTPDASLADKHVDGHMVHMVAADRAEFDGFGGGLTRRAKMRPAGQIHALAHSARSTLCGQPLTELLAFPGRTFEGEETPGKCPHCWKLVSLSRRQAAARSRRL